MDLNKDIEAVHADMRKAKTYTITEEALLAMKYEIHEHSSELDVEHNLVIDRILKKLQSKEAG